MSLQVQSQVLVLLLTPTTTPIRSTNLQSLARRHALKRLNKFAGPKAQRRVRIFFPISCCLILKSSNFFDNCAVAGDPGILEPCMRRKSYFHFLGGGHLAEPTSPKARFWALTPPIKKSTFFHQKTSFFRQCS